jgi:hypothetical protein
MNLAAISKQRSLTTEEKCIAYLEKMRWPEGIRCPTCTNHAISRFRAKGKSGKTRYLYQCLGKTCRYQFSPTTGTIFHDSHLPLTKWFRAIALLSDAEKPMSTNQLRIALGVQYKTAAHLAGRIRQAMETGSIELTATTEKLSAARVVAGSPGVAPRGAAADAPVQAANVVARKPAASPQTMQAYMAQRRQVTAELLKQIGTPAGQRPVSSTAVDNMLSMFVSMAQMSVRPPLFFVNYLKEKVFT